MPVSVSYAPLSYSGNGVTTSFAVTWPFYSATLRVTKIASTGVETVQTISTHYTVTGGTDTDGLPATGSVTMLTAPASGEQIRIERVTPLTQTIDLTAGGDFNPKVVTSGLDKLTLGLQERSGSGTVNDGIAGDVMELVTSGATDYWDAESQVIRNVADAIGLTDAVNYGQLQQVVIDAGAGDVIGPTSSVDGEIALFDATSGKLLKRASTTGLLKATSGVVAAATAGTDYVTPAGLTSAIANVLETDDIGVSVQGYDADTLKADTADVLTAGFAATVYNAGTQSSGTYTPNEANGNMQRAVNGGAHTLAPPTNNCTLIVQYTNNASAGTITTSGFTRVIGAFTTVNGDDFMCYITRNNGFTLLNIAALQ